MKKNIIIIILLLTSILNAQNSVKRNPDNRKDFVNLFYNSSYTLFDLWSDEPIFPDNFGYYRIYITTVKECEYNMKRVVYTDSQVVSATSFYKFKNSDNCKNWCLEQLKKNNEAELKKMREARIAEINNKEKESEDKNNSQPSPLELNFKTLSSNLDIDIKILDKNEDFYNNNKFHTKSFINNMISRNSLNTIFELDSSEMSNSLEKRNFKIILKDIIDTSKLLVSCNNYKKFIDFKYDSLFGNYIEEINKFNNEFGKSKFFKTYNIKSKDNQPSLNLYNNLFTNYLFFTKSYFSHETGLPVVINMAKKDGYYIFIDREKSFLLHPLDSFSNRYDLVLNVKYLKSNEEHYDETNYLGYMDKKDSKQIYEYIDKNINSLNLKNNKILINNECKFAINSNYKGGSFDYSYYDFLERYWEDRFKNIENNIHQNLKLTIDTIITFKKKIEAERIAAKIAEEKRIAKLKEKTLVIKSDSYEVVDGNEDLFRRFYFSDLTHESIIGEITMLSIFKTNQTNNEKKALIYFNEILDKLISKNYVDESVANFINNVVKNKMTYKFLIDSKILVEKQTIIETPSLGTYSITKHSYSLMNIIRLIIGELKNNDNLLIKIREVMNNEVILKTETEYVTELSYILKDFWQNSFDYSINSQKHGTVDGSKYRYKLEIYTKPNNLIFDFYNYLEEGLSYISDLNKKNTLYDNNSSYKIWIDVNSSYIDDVYYLSNSFSVSKIKEIFDSWNICKFPKSISDGYFNRDLRNLLGLDRASTNSSINRNFKTASSVSSMPFYKYSSKSMGKYEELYINKSSLDLNNYPFLNLIFLDYDVNEDHYMQISKFSIIGNGRHKIVD